MNISTRFAIYDLVFVALRKPGGGYRASGPFTVQAVYVTQAAGADQITQYSLLDNEGHVTRVRERHVFGGLFKLLQKHPGAELSSELEVGA